MAEPTTVLEKFLTESIQTASEEIQEELEAMKEGSDLSHSISVIEKILKDLLNSSEPYVEPSDLTSSMKNAQEKIEKEIERRGIELRYSIGDELIFDGTVYQQSYQIKNFKQKFEIPDDTQIGNDGDEIENKMVTVIGRIFPIETHRNSYAVEYEGTIYFVDEVDLNEP